MNRRDVIVSGLAASGLTACATGPAPGGPPAQPNYPVDGSAQGAPPPQRAPEYTPDELVRAGSDFLGVTAEAVGATIERIATEQNGRRPTAYIAGEEASGAIAVGLRYGRGVLYMKTQTPQQEVFWQGPTVGWDFGGNAARVFTLVYNLQRPDDVFRRFPGVEGSAYLIGGLGVNYQAADGIVLAPIRAGLGLRLGANVGYLAYSRRRNILPF
jgi:hypothetical protein